MLIIIILSILIRPVYMKTNKNKFNIDYSGNTSDNKINDKITNLSNTTKKLIFEASFLYF